MESYKLFWVILPAISGSQSERSYTNDELAVIRRLGNSMGISSFTFVQSHQDVELIQEIKVFQGSLLFSAVASLDELDTIVNDDFRQSLFFEKKTALVTKEKLNFTSLLEKLSDIRSITWVVFVESPNAISDYFIPLDIDFFIVQCISDTIVVNRAYHIKHGRNISVQSVATWPKGGSDALRVEKEEINFTKTTLTLLFYLREKDCSGKSSKHVLDRMECFHQEMVKIIAEKLNFTLNRVECSERLYPYNYPNGSLSELFLALSRREVDISSGSFIVSSSRMQLLDFAWPTFTTRSMMYIKFEDSKSSWRAYLRPMDPRVWKAIACWIVLTGLLVELFDELREGSFVLRGALLLELMQSVFLSLQVFCNQGIHNMSRWYSIRIVFVLTFLLFISLYQAYSGFLISSLTVSTPDIPFTDFDEFLRDGSYTFLTLNRGYHNYFLKKIFKDHKINEGNFIMSNSGLPNSTRLAIEKLCSLEKLTYVEFRESIVEHELPCKITELPKPLLYQNLGLGFPKKSHYKTSISRQITILRSAGILNRMNRYLLSYVKLSQKEVSEEEYIKVSFRHVVSIFFILGSGTAIAAAIFLLEILWNPSTNRKIFQVYRKKINRLKRN